MTLKEKLAREHPECINSKNPGGCDGCPKEYGYSNVCLRTHKGCADIYKDICAACWDQEYIEPESKSEENPYIKIAHDMRLAIDAFNAEGFTRLESLEVIKAMMITMEVES